MVEFLNKDKAFAEIVEIVSKAKSKLVLISPYIKIPDDLLERLKYMDGKGIRTIVVCREKDLNAEVRGQLKQLKNLELRFDEDLHAKCFYNEESMVITSLNLHEHSQQHNREMGILLSSEKDSNVFKEALSESEFIVSRAKKD
ncbi:MAG TPA: phospholipase D-like domain-containing protein, partial [Dehalococcoidales bacterium]|nr:phospholipase D-like domain-containing protein [Dehalococcoidales bacterium]